MLSSTVVPSSEAVPSIPWKSLFFNLKMTSSRNIITTPFKREMYVPEVKRMIDAGRQESERKKTAPAPREKGLSETDMNQLSSPKSK